MKKMTKEEFVARCVSHMENYYKDGYYKTAAWKEDCDLAYSEEQLFVCPDCGEAVPFSDLEFWAGDMTAQDVLDGKVSCACCYEDAMGEDL